MHRSRIASGVILTLASCAAPPPAPPGPREVLAEVFEGIKTVYVAPVEDSVLVTSCTSGIRQYLAAQSPPAEVPNVSPREGAPPGETIGNLLAEATRSRPGLDDRAMTEACMSTMLSSLDKLSHYMNAQEFRELRVGSRGEIGAIGLELKAENRFPVVVSVIESSPASRSDLRSGDIIASIDSSSTKDLPLKEVVQRLRGKPGSSVVLGLRRAGVPGTSRLELKREIIRLQSVWSATTPEGYAHIRIARFQDSTLDALGRALRSARADGSRPVPGIILDLRNNTGGLLKTAIGVAAAFLPATALVSDLKGRAEDSNRRMHARPDDYLPSASNDPFQGLPETAKTAPLVVIVNSRTASGAEIVAAALQDHGRAKLIGERTAGVGTVQTIFPLGGGTAMRLTTAKFHRPNGEAIEGHPVVPDVPLSASEAALSPGSSADLALLRTRKLLSSSP